MILILWFLLWVVTAIGAIACIRAMAWHDWRNGAYYNREDAAFEEFVVALFCVIGGIPFFLLCACCLTRHHGWPTWQLPPSGTHTDVDKAIMKLEQKIQLLDEEQARLQLSHQKRVIVDEAPVISDVFQQQRYAAQQEK